MRSTPQGDACQGGGVPTTSPVVAGGSLRGSCGTPQGRGTHSPVPQSGLFLGTPSRMTAG